MGTIYFDTSSKGRGHGLINRWTAEVYINGRRFRYRSADKKKCEEYLERITQERMGECVKIKDFPDYVINLHNGDIFRVTNSRMLRLKPHMNGGIRTVGIYGKQKSVPRLLYAVRHDISYHDIPDRGFSLYLDEEGNISVKTTSEIAQQRCDEKRELAHEYREKDIEDNIHGLQLLLRAYRGDELPLLEYMASKKKQHVRTICKRTAVRWEKALAAYETTMDIFLGYIRKTPHTIYSVDAWFITKACRIVSGQGKRKYVDIDRVRSLSGNKY